MEWLGDLIAGGAAVAGGGVFGLLGSVVGQVSKFIQEKQRQAWEKEKWGHEQAMFRLRMEAKAEETEQEIELVSQQGAWSGLTESIKADVATQGASQWVINVAKLFRPFLTLVLVVCSMVIIIKMLNGALNDILTQDQINDIVRYSIYSLIFSTATAIAWWWGDRALTPPHLKHR